MINTERIVPITVTDLISVYGFGLKQNSNNSGLVALDALDVVGNFKVTSGSAPMLASEPVKSCDIDATTSSVTACTIYFVPAYDFEGFSIDGTKVQTAGVTTIARDGRTLYKAVLASGTITVSKESF